MNNDCAFSWWQMVASSVWSFWRTHLIVVIKWIGIRKSIILLCGHIYIVPFNAAYIIVLLFQILSVLVELFVWLHLQVLSALFDINYPPVVGCWKVSHSGWKCILRVCLHMFTFSRTWSREQSGKSKLFLNKLSLFRLCGLCRLNLKWNLLIQHS